MKTSTLAVLLLLLSLLTGNSTKAQRISVTLAGNATAAYSGDGSSGKLASMNAPYDVCMDAAQNLYFSDMGNGRIRKLAAKDGRITTIAGGGSSAADGISALTAAICPRNICIDAAGNIFFADSVANKIRRIDAVTNVITTIAGNGTAGYSGDGGPATSAAFNDIYGICIDAAGNIYLVDQANFRVRKVTAATGIVTTIAGNGVSGDSGDGGPATMATLYTPTAICVNAAGEVIFVDQAYGYLSELRKIDAAGNISDLAGPAAIGDVVFGMPALSTWLGVVTGICTDAAGNYFFNEISCSCRKLSVITDSIYAVGGNFGIESFGDNVNSALAYMNNPDGICTDAASNVYVADNFNNRIRKLIQLTNTPTYAYGKGGFMSACAGAPVSFDSLLSITDLDSTVTVTWTVISAPSHGVLSGFPVSAPSVGTASIVKPSSGPSYTLASGFSGADSFLIQVSDGTLSDTMTIYVSAGAGPISGPATVCMGSNITLAGSYSGGLWSASNTNAAVTSGGMITGFFLGIDTISYTVTNSCGVVTTQEAVNIGLAPNPGVITSSEPTTLCIGTTLALDDVSAGGTWSLVNGDLTVSTTGLLTALSAGTDTVIYTIVNSCGTASASRSIVVTNCTAAGVPVIATTPSVNIFPNPASTILNIEGQSLGSNASYTLTDITGRILMNNMLPDAGNATSTAAVNVAELKDGVYLLYINSDAGHFASKVVISK